MKVLVISPSWIGDVIMSQSFYRTLKMKHPQVTIDVIAPMWTYSLLSNMSEISETILMPLNHNELRIDKRFKLGRNLSKKQYNRAYVLPNSFKSALIPFFANIPHRIGWLGEMRYGILNDIRILNKIKWPLMVERYVALAYDKNTVCSARDLLRPLLRPYLQVNSKEKIKTCDIFNISDKRPIIGFCPGSAFGLVKCWPDYHYAKLAEQLINNGFQILLFGSIKDIYIGDKILNILHHSYQIWCRNLVGCTQIKQVIALIDICKAIVTNDSGLMHIAAALNRPLIALYGLSNPNFTPPLSNRAQIIRLVTGNYKINKSNTINNYHQSLIAITPQYVFEELNNLLSREQDINNKQYASLNN